MYTEHTPMFEGALQFHCSVRERGRVDNFYDLTDYAEI
jgi:hypothetical protein